MGVSRPPKVLDAFGRINTVLFRSIRPSRVKRKLEVVLDEIGCSLASHEEWSASKSHCPETPFLSPAGAL